MVCRHPGSEKQGVEISTSTGGKTRAEAVTATSD